jgi:hypothetical protein
MAVIGDVPVMMDPQASSAMVASPRETYHIQKYGLFLREHFQHHITKHGDCCRAVAPLPNAPKSSSSTTMIPSYYVIFILRILEDNS